MKPHALLPALLLATAPALAEESAEADAYPSPTCLEDLAEIAVFAAAEVPETGDEACTFFTPIQLESVVTEGGPVGLSGTPVLQCDFALQLARWIRQDAVPAATLFMDSRLEELATGNGFVCRRRNNAPDGKLSEHAFGNAIDISGFRFDDARITIADSEELSAGEDAFFDAVRKQACDDFTTVLGPGSNAAHADHFHFDLGRTVRDGVRVAEPYRICE